MTFHEYQHVERLGTSEVEGITDGKCYVFPKLDGTNASVWQEDGVLCFGSRNRQLSLENDNAGFMAKLYDDGSLADFFMDYPDLHLYGEWLVPHSHKEYEDDAWRKFYVFDIIENPTEWPRYLHYEEMKSVLAGNGIDYIEPLAIIVDGSVDQFEKCLEQNTYLCKDGTGVGEGIVIKRYDYVNKYGRVKWAKLVTNDFKTKHRGTMGPPEIQGVVDKERRIAIKYVTLAIINKEYAKIVLDNDGWSRKDIPRLLNCVFYEIIREEAWNFIKEHKFPQLDFKRLMKCIMNQTKVVKPELF